MNNHLPNIHPGEILQLEFLEPMNISAYRLSKDIAEPLSAINRLTHKIYDDLRPSRPNFHPNELILTPKS